MAPGRASGSEVSVIAPLWAMRSPHGWSRSPRLAADRRVVADGHHAALVGEDHRLHAIAESQLHQHPADVCLDRRLRNHELVGDLVIRQPAAAKAEDLPLAGGERGELSVAGTAASVIGWFLLGGIPVVVGEG